MNEKEQISVPMEILLSGSKKNRVSKIRYVLFLPTQKRSIELNLNFFQGFFFMSENVIFYQFP